LHADIEHIEVGKCDVLDGPGQRNASAHLARGHCHDEPPEGLGSRQ
jgi:hypothetical protein